MKNPCPIRQKIERPTHPQNHLKKRIRACKTKNSYQKEVEEDVLGERGEIREIGEVEEGRVNGQGQE